MTTTRDAACSCGQLQALVTGDPVRVSMCHCLACQRRTGSTYGVQARFRADQVRVAGRISQYVHESDEDGAQRVFGFCPDCGGTIVFTVPTDPDLVAVPVGAFADPSFPPPARSVHGTRRHAWVSVPEGAERFD